MKSQLILIFGLIISICMPCYAQQTGTEQLVTKNVYKGEFTVAGDKDTYYLALRRLLFSYGRNAAFSRSVKVPKLRVRKELRGL